MIRRDGQTFIWSRGEELVTDRFPEIAAAADFLPDGTVLDGEIMPWKDGAPLPFAQLQRRIGRKTLGAKILSRSAGGADRVRSAGARTGATFAASRWRGVARECSTTSIADARSAAFIPSPIVPLAIVGAMRAPRTRARAR